MKQKLGLYIGALSLLSSVAGAYVTKTTVVDRFQSGTYADTESIFYPYAAKTVSEKYSFSVDQKSILVTDLKTRISYSLEVKDEAQQVNPKLIALIRSNPLNVSYGPMVKNLRVRNLRVDSGKIAGEFLLDLDSNSKFLTISTTIAIAFRAQALECLVQPFEKPSFNRGCVDVVVGNSIGVETLKLGQGFTPPMQNFMAGILDFGLKLSSPNMVRTHRFYQDQ